MVWQLAQSWPSITITLLVIYWIAIAIVIISDEREPTETLAWLLVAFAFPLLGLLFYFLFGRNWKKIAAAQRMGQGDLRARAPHDEPRLGEVLEYRARTCSTGRSRRATRRSSRRRSPRTPRT